MSARRMKQMLNSDNLLNNEEESDEEDIIIQHKPSQNLFAALTMEDEESEEEESEEIIIEKPKPKPKRKKKQSKKNKRKPQKKKVTEDDLLDQAIKEVENSTPIIKENEESSLLGVNTKYLLAENEIKRMFGSDAIIKDDNEKPKNQLRNRKNKQKTRIANFKQNTKLAKPDINTWPPLRPDDLIMSPIDPPDDIKEEGIKYFVFKWSQRNQLAQQQFKVCIESGDPNSLFQLLQQYPYHVGTLLQLSELLKQTGDFQRGADFIERALYSFECGWHVSFNWETNTSRILHRYEENRELFYCLFRHIQMLGRRGCCRTGLECCKLLLSFDHSDPLFVVGMIDYFAIRSKQFTYLLEFNEKFKKKPKYLPNLYFSVPLAIFLICQEN